MEHGFVRAAAATPRVKPTDCGHNAAAIINLMEQASAVGCDLLALPELCVTGATCGDLFLNAHLTDGAEEALLKIVKASQNKKMAVVAGLPVRTRGRLFNCAAVVCGGKLVGIAPKAGTSGGVFSPGDRANFETIEFCGGEVPFGADLIFCHLTKKDFAFAVEIGSDFYLPTPPSSLSVPEGARIVVNISALRDRAFGPAKWRGAVSCQSERLACVYVCACAGLGESTTDAVYSGHNLIVEDGEIVAEAKLFENETVRADVDSESAPLSPETRTKKNSSRRAAFYFDENENDLERRLSTRPFLPDREEDLEAYCLETLMMQSAGLAQRIEATGAESVVVAVSGGLDSTLALLVAVEAALRTGLDLKNIRALSMPCFGTSFRTRRNARLLAESLGVTFVEIEIGEAVRGHFEDIGREPDDYGVVYENAQARERTQVAMDYAALHKGFMVGTGDLSELALGFATYGGDHMSMYNVNASIPKTLIRPVISAAAKKRAGLRDVLEDILRTPISPELLPEREGVGAQETESIVGPYELHDFFIYHMLKRGKSPEKIFYLACGAFNGKYERGEIKKWLEVFLRRFFAGQFKRSCSPDGPAVGQVSLSPRGFWRMPSDASAKFWQFGKRD
ncbi:MAG: NAD(+) synthase [Defluviitaleaceae bacterium]|nr:NAD(+) synthase [Defluviitaleaceae bacterium]